MNYQYYRIAADLVVVCHLIFIVYAVLGGLLAVKWPVNRFMHLPCAAWAAWISFSGRICPLTPLENHLRYLGNAPGYAGSFIERYLVPVIYPVGLTRHMQFAMGGLVILAVVLPYAWIVVRHRCSKTEK